MEVPAAERVLVIEDDPDMRLLLRLLLEDHGYDVDDAGDGATAMAALDAGDPAVILLDLGLPDMGGHDLVRAIRDRCDTPIIVLSGRSAESDRVLALEFGADDYVVKPFLHNELVARVRARLRRVPASPDGSTVLEDAAGLVVDSLGRQVRVDGRPVELTAREFDLLAYLHGSPRRVFSRAHLLERVWGSSAEWQHEATVTEHVHRLRRKIGDGYITTVRGVGYRFDPS